MNWWRRADLLDRLAGEYALGTLHGGARRRFEAVMGAHPAVARAVSRWTQDLQPLDSSVRAAPADPALWQRIEGRVFGAALTSGPAGSPAAVQTWWVRWLGPRPATALAFGLVAGLAVPTLVPFLQPSSTSETQLPESYVGVLATADGRPGLVVSSLRRGRTLDIKVVRAVALPAGRQWVLWLIDARGSARAVTALPALTSPFTSVALPADSETLFATAVELAVSAEAADAPLVALQAPNGPFAWRGLCGKLWRLPPAAAASAPPPASR